MDPLIEVSTVGGRNMRETCARVLAAALMTGAIATVVAMSALFEVPSGPGRPIAAPPSSLQRSVLLEAQPARPHRTRVTRLENAHPITRPARPVAPARSLVVTPTRHVRAQPRRLATVTPKPKPASAPTPAAQPDAPPPPAAPPVEAAPAGEQEDAKPDKEHDHGHGHEGDNGHKGHDGHDGHED
jgi:hypothetical protein